MRRLKLASGLLLTLLSAGSWAQTEQQKIDAQAVRTIMAECRETLVRSVEEIQVLDKKLPGILPGTDLIKTDSSTLLDQNQVPSRAEREKIFLARTILATCLHKAKMVGLAKTPSYITAMREVSDYYAQLIWANFINQPTSFGNFNETRKFATNFYKSEMERIGVVSKQMAGDWQEKSKAIYTPTEKNFLKAVSDHDAIIKEKIAAGHTYCRKLSAFTYCEPD